MNSVSAEAIQARCAGLSRVPRLGAPAGSDSTRRHWRSRMYCGQLPNVCSTATAIPPFAVSAIRPFTRLRRREASSMPRIPTSVVASRDSASASPATGFASMTRDRGSGDVMNPSCPASSVAHGRPVRSRAATTRKGSAVWNARCSSGRWSRTTLRAQVSISRTPRRSWTPCSPAWNGDGPLIVPSGIDLTPIERPVRVGPPVGLAPERRGEGRSGTHRLRTEI